MPQITYTDKSEGSNLTPADVNEIKNVVNGNHEFNSSVSYSLNELVPYQGITYKSLQNANLGHTPVTDGSEDLWWEEVKTGGGVEVEGTVAVATDLGKPMYMGSDGKFYVASNDELETSVVAGLLISATASADENGSVLKSGYLEGLSGLTPGVDYFLGNNGALITSGDIDFYEYKVYLGRAIDAETMDVNIKYPEPTIYQNLDPIGSIKYFSTYKDRSAQGFLPFDFDNAISIANYPKLFEEIGHIYNDQHVAAGDADLSGLSTLFYPTPVPGAYDRVAIPDSEDIDSTSAIDTGNDTITLSQADYNKFKRMKYYSDSYNGVPVYLKLESGSLPTGLSEDTIYYLRFTDDANYYVKLYTSEANAIDDTSAVDITATATGTFHLTQEGINLDDAEQGHKHSTNSTSKTLTGNIRLGSAAGIVRAYSGGILSAGTSYSIGPATTNTTCQALNIDATHSHGTGAPLTDGTNGTPRTTNETRPKTNFLYGYIKAEYVTTAGEPISALRYDTGWVANSDWTDAEFTINHNLNTAHPNLLITFLVSPTGSDTDTLECSASDYDSSSTPPLERGYTIKSSSLNSIKIQTGSNGIIYYDNSGTGVLIDTESWYYKVVITKPNLVSTVFDVSSLPKTYDLTSGDITVTLPEITGVLQTKSIYWKNGGTYKLTLAVTDGATVGGETASTWEGEGEGHILLESDGSNWQVREYEDTEDWHEVGASGEPAFLNGWTYDNTLTHAQFRFHKGRDNKKRIQFRGGLDGSSATDIFVCTLPIKYRPQNNNSYWTTITYEGTQVVTEMSLWTDGTVYINEYGHSPNRSKFIGDVYID